MLNLDKLIIDSKIIGIAGHIHPDGDCVGSTLGLYNYIVNNYPEKDVRIYLQEFNDSYSFLKNVDKIKNKSENIIFDVFFALDSADEDRIGIAFDAFKNAKTKVVIDHHITNQGFGDLNIIDSKASSASEVLFNLLDDKRINKEVAECIYLGIIQDTGLFQYSCTSSKTMNIAGKLIDKGINYTQIVEDTFFVKTYLENKVVAYVIDRCKLYHNDKIIVGTLDSNDIEKLGITKKDTESVVANLRNTKGIEIAVFIYQLNIDEFKISLRAKSEFDVSKVAVKFGGGGHKKAAGFSINANNINEAISIILNELK